MLDAAKKLTERVSTRHYGRGSPILLSWSRNHIILIKTSPDIQVSQRVQGTDRMSRNGEHYPVYLSSTDSLSTYPSNTADDFTSILAKEVRLDELREWEVGVVEMKMTPSADNFYICCDFVEPSIGLGGEISYYIDTPFYMKMTRKNLERMRIYLSDEKGSVGSVASGLLGVTLDIRERK